MQRPPPASRTSVALTRDPDDVAVVVQVAALAAGGRDLPGRACGRASSSCCAVLGVQQAHDRRALELAPGWWPVIAQSARLTCRKRPSSAAIAMPIGASSKAVRKRSSASAWRALGLGAVVDVADRGVHLGDAADAVADGEQLRVGPAPGAVGAAQADRDGGARRRRAEPGAHRRDAGRGVARGARGRRPACPRAAPGARSSSSRQPPETSRHDAVRGERGEHVAGVARRVRASARRRRGGPISARPSAATASIAWRSRRTGVDAQSQQSARPQSTSQTDSERWGAASGPTREQQQGARERGKGTEGGGGTAVARRHPLLVGYLAVRLKSCGELPLPAPARRCTGSRRRPVRVPPGA